MKVKVGDTVRIITGKDKGKEGKVLHTYASKNRVVVEGLNLVKRHSKPRTNEDKGGIFDIEASIHVSNVKVVDKKDAKVKENKVKEVKETKKAESKEVKKTATKKAAPKKTAKKETK